MDNQQEQVLDSSREQKHFGTVNPKQAEDMTKLICQTLEMVLGIPASKTYVTYQGFTDWGWNGRIF